MLHHFSYVTYNNIDNNIFNNNNNNNKINFVYIIITSYGDVVKESPDRRSPRFSALAFDFRFLQNGKS